MLKHAGFAPLLFLTVLALAGNGGDAVNERIPVSKAALEDHWRVDCASAWARLKAAAAQRSPQDHCGIPDGLAQEIKLCAFIYQPPGDGSQQDCPDYRGISQLLENSGHLTDCPNLPTLIANNMICDAANP
jgi:hypothetical protein